MVQRESFFEEWTNLNNSSDIGSDIQILFDPEFSQFVDTTVIVKESCPLFSFFAREFQV